MAYFLLRIEGQGNIVELRYCYLRARLFPMSQGLENLKHIVVLMMENRSFDHMLGGLKKKYPKINGLDGNESNPDIHGNAVKVSPNAAYRGQLSHDPDHHFPGVDIQIFGGAAPSPRRVPNMQGFVKSYATQGTGDRGS